MRKRIIVFNDFCGLGLIALKMNMHAIMANNIEAIGVPTGIFSAPMDYKEFVMSEMPIFDDYVNSISQIYDSFDGVLIGYVGNMNNAKTIERFVRKFGRNKTILDPIMGDNGKLYSGTKSEQVDFYRELIPYTKILIPNVTEALILTDMPLERYKEINEDLKIEVLNKLKNLGAKNVILKGEASGEKFINSYYNGVTITEVDSPYIPGKFHGTGDLIAGLIAVAAAKNKLDNKTILKAQEIISEVLKNEKPSQEILPDPAKIKL